MTTGGWAARYTDERITFLEISENSTVADAISAVGIPASEAGIVVLDGKAVPKDHLLSNGDEIKIHPLIIGG